MTGKSFYRLLLIVGILFLAVSCSKKVIPAVVQTEGDKSYDLAKFNYVYVEAVKQKLLGNGGEALKYLEEAVKINPESDAAYYQMAQIVSASGDISNGKKYLAKALSFDNKNIWYLMMMGGFYYQERNLDSAIYFYENAVKGFPDEENLLLTLGNLYAENKSFEKALNIFNSFDARYGVNENSTVSAIRTLLSEGKYEEALLKAQLLIKEFPEEILYNGLIAEIYVQKGDNSKAREVYDTLLIRNPEDPRIQLAVCDFLINIKDYEELFLILNKVILNSDIKREDKITLFARMIELTDLVNKNSNDLMVALMVLEANYKDDDIVTLLRPELLVKTGKLDDAECRLEEIIRQKPENYYAWEKLLLVLNQEKDYKKLMVKGEECASRFNRSFLAKILYANGALESKEFETALGELRKAEILAGDNRDFRIQVFTMRADIYYRQKDYSKAFETFEEALRENGEDLTVINNYAYYLAEQDKSLKEAEEMARKVIEKEKDNTTYLDTYAWVLYKRGKLKEAAKVMEKIINSGEAPDAEWYEHYGFILSKQDNCSKAIENWNMAMQLDSTKTNLLEEIKNCGK